MTYRHSGNTPEWRPQFLVETRGKKAFLSSQQVSKSSRLAGAVLPRGESPRWQGPLQEREREVPEPSSRVHSDAGCLETLPGPFPCNFRSPAQRPAEQRDHLPSRNLGGAGGGAGTEAGQGRVGRSSPGKPPAPPRPLPGPPHSRGALRGGR